MAFTGLPTEGIEFYEQLAADNSKSFWLDNKHRYVEHVKEPVTALTEELADFGPFHMFRPHNDLRFSKNKPPYKTHQGAYGELEAGSGYYVQFSADGVMAGAGYYSMAKDQLTRFRELIDADATGTALADIVAALRKKKLDVTAIDTLKTAPRGYPKDHPRVELLRMKGCLAAKTFGAPKWIHTRAAATRVRDLWESASPLTDWLDAHVGPSTMPPRTTVRSEASARRNSGRICALGCANKSRNGRGNYGAGMADLFLGGTIDPATHERTTDDATSHISVATDKLTTHGVIVGMTGSGKTGLGVIVIEEALKAGLPVIAIDPKGDLTNLALTFPDLAPSDFRPWIDEAQAKNAGQTPDEFAASQAGLWEKGLGGWGLSGADIGELRSKTDFSIYTPGSNAGIPMNIVGSLQVPTDMSDAEVISDEIEGYVSGLLGLVGISADPLSSREHILISNLINHSWLAGKDIDLMTLVGQIASPPIRKLGVFELDQFFPEADRMALAMKLNGLLASPSFAAWSAGPPLDIDAMMFGPDGKNRCAIITTAHLSDDERQFVTSLVLAKLVTWMRRQSGTTDLRAMLYMDEVAGYLPPTANPPTKKPIMLLMKQARAFGVGVILSTQNPVDVDYKALSNAGTWMIGRLQTDRDKARLLDGMSSAAGGVDIGAVGDTISGLGKREFMLRRAGKDTPEVFTTRWAMSYLRGPMTRDQIEQITGDTPVATAPAAMASGGAASGATATATAPPPAAEPALADDESAIMPDVAPGTPVRYVDVAAPWLEEVGGDARGDRRAAAVVARVSLRYDETKADLVHDDEYEAVLFPIDEQVDATQIVQVDYDDRDLRTNAPDDVVYRLSDGPIKNKTFWTQVERDIRDQLTRTLTLELPANVGLKLYGRPGEDADAFEARCLKIADDKADEEIAKLRDKYETKARSLRDKIEAAEDRIEELEEQTKSKRNSELLSTAGSVLGGLLGGRKSKSGLLGGLLGKAGTAARRRGTTNASAGRLETAENKMQRLVEQVEDLEMDLEEDVTEIDAKWMEAGKDITSLSVGLEKTDVKVTQLVLAWVPVT